MTIILEDVKRLLDAIPADDRDDWIKVGMALHAELGQAGLPLWETWSQRSEKFKPGECEKKWKGFKADGGVGYGTLVHMAGSGYQRPAASFKPKVNGNGKPKAEIDWKHPIRTHYYGDSLRKTVYPEGDGKTAVWQHRNGAGWKNGYGDQKPDLYRQDEIESADPEIWVCLSESEKDADRLVNLGMVGTSHPGGASEGLKPEYIKTLAGRRVAILVHNDEPGRKWAAGQAALLAQAGAEVKVIWPEAGGWDFKAGGDVSDLIDRRMDDVSIVEHLQGIVEATSVWAPEPELDDPDAILELIITAKAAGDNHIPLLKELAKAMVDADTITAEDVADRLKDAKVIAKTKFLAAVHDAKKKRKKAEKVSRTIDRSDYPTWPYEVREGRIMFNKEVRVSDDVATFKPVPVCDFTAEIVSEITREDGVRFFGIEGETVLSRPFSLEISATDFSKPSELKAELVRTAGAKAPVAARMEAHLAPAIQKLSGHDLKQIRRFDRVGWLDDKFLMPGRVNEDTAIRLPRELPYEVGGDTDQALTAFDTLLRVMPGDQITVLLSFVFQAPLARLMDWRESDRYALFITGQTGQFKTTVAQAAMAIYGGGFLNDSGLIRWGEGATQNGIMALATRAADAPILIDNYKPSTGGGEAAFYRLLHAILEGGEKTRLTRAAELKESKAIYAWPVFTGEDTPRKDAASLARLLEVKWAGVDTDALTTMQESAAALPAIGAMWLDWLETPEARKITQRYKGEFSDTRKRWADQIRGNEKDAQNIMRVASNLAGNEITWQILQSHPALGVYARSNKLPDLHRTGLDSIAAAMAEATAKGVEAVRFIEALQSLVGSGRCTLTRISQPITTLEPDRHIGWEDDKGVYLVPDLAMQAVLKLLNQNALGNVSNQKINNQLLELGLIAKVDKSGRVPIVKKCGGKSQRVIHLKREAIYLASESEQ